MCNVFVRKSFDGWDKSAFKEAGFTEVSIGFSANGKNLVLRAEKEKVLSMAVSELYTISEDSVREKQELFLSEFLIQYSTNGKCSSTGRVVITFEDLKRVLTTAIKTNVMPRLFLATKENIGETTPMSIDEILAQKKGHAEAAKKKEEMRIKLQEESAIREKQFLKMIRDGKYPFEVPDYLKEKIEQAVA